VRRNKNGTKEILFPAQELGIPEMYHDSWPVRPSKVYVYTYEGVVIWGLTAEIVRELSKILRGVERHAEDMYGSLSGAT
jgi:hypothetical protein